MGLISWWAGLEAGGPWLPGLPLTATVLSFSFPLSSFLIFFYIFFPCFPLFFFPVGTTFALPSCHAPECQCFSGGTSIGRGPSFISGDSVLWLHLGDALGLPGSGGPGSMCSWIPGSQGTGTIRDLA